MPELPEVETVKTGIQKGAGQIITNVIIRNRSLRYKIPAEFTQQALNQPIKQITRRAKYLILHLENGFIVIHLGMSGSLTFLAKNNMVPELKKHDHVDLVLEQHILRYNDPRRFGLIIYTQNIEGHPLFKNLGPEPLEDSFNTKYLIKQLLNRKSTIKQLIMANEIVVGVGNIYACEALFLAKILPTRPGNSLTEIEVCKLVECIKQVLAKAISLGGSSLRDYKQADGTLGYFQTTHNVYARNNKKCNNCEDTIVEKRLGQRNSFYCPNCQK